MIRVPLHYIFLHNNFYIKRCEKGKKLKKEIINYRIGVREYDYSSNIDFDSQQILDFYQSAERLEDSNEIISKIKDFQEIEYHQSISKRQRNVYNNQRKDSNLLNENILIEFDFKEKIIVGIGPREV